MIRLFDGKVFLVAGGSVTLRGKLCSLLLARYKGIGGIVLLQNSRKEYQWEKEQYKNPLIKVRLCNFYVQKNLSNELDGVDFFLDATFPEDAGNTKKLLRNSISWARNVVEASMSKGVKKVLALSSSKACNPSDLPGTLRLLKEKILIAGNTGSIEKGLETRFSVLRLGVMSQALYQELALLSDFKDKGCLSIPDAQATKFWFIPEERAGLIHRFFVKMEGGEVFVPQAPSVSIIKLAQFICPDCQYKETGLPPGEKLHEELISTSEGGSILAYGDYYLIQPEFPWWNKSEYAERTGGREAPAGFSYRSDTNTWSLGDEEMGFILKMVIRKGL